MTVDQTGHGENRQPHHTSPDHGVVSQDGLLVSEVKEALLRGTESAGIDVKVDVRGGVVRLHGVVDVLSHRTASEEIARRIPGVQGIENEITVANEEAVPDKELMERITDRLARSEAGRNVGVRVHRGAVSLVGHTESYEDVSNAVRLIEGMAGVRSVRVERVKVGEGRDEDDADVARAAEKLLDEIGFDHRLFQVYCDAGTLFVKGFVHTADDRSRLKSAMHRIQGVDRVEATLVTEDEME